MRAHPIGCVERPHRPLEEQERRSEMLGTAKAFSGFSVDDIDAAKGFHHRVVQGSRGERALRARSELSRGARGPGA